MVVMSGTSGDVIAETGILVDGSDNVTGVVGLTASGTFALADIEDVAENIKADSSTGILEGGEVTINAGNPAQVDVAAGDENLSF